MNRRHFLQSALAAPMVPTPASAPWDRMVGIQIPAVSFLDEGVESVLDTVQSRGRVNTLFLIAYSYAHGLTGRQISPHPFPDHGKPEYQPGLVGGYYGVPHPEFYRDTRLKNFRNPELNGYDMLGAVLPSARKRGLKSIGFFSDNLPEKSHPERDFLSERALDGSPVNTACFNNPEFRAHLLGLLEDCLTHYPLDGVLWRSEAPGPITRVLGFSHIQPIRASCFCQHCQSRAKAAGTDIERARKGYQELEAFAARGRRGDRPIDGYFTTFWRLLLDYPEIVAWNSMWVAGLRDMYQAVYAKVKRLQPSALVGWAIAHNNVLNPLFRAENDIARMTPYSDFLKILTYHNSGGERLVKVLEHVTASLLGDLTKAQALEFITSVMGQPPAKLESIARTGFPPSFVAEETRKALLSVKGSATRIWPGLDVDLPTAPESAKCTPTTTRAAALGCLQAGAHGVLMARKYSEMRLANIDAVGEAVKEFGWA